MSCTGKKCRCDEPAETAADINDQHVRDINADRTPADFWNEEAKRKALEIGEEIRDGSYGSPLFEIDNQEERIDGPAHYGGKDNPYEAIKIIEAHELGFLMGNAVKYILRAGKKIDTTELDDLAKARWYINHRINQITGG